MQFSGLNFNPIACGAWACLCAIAALLIVVGIAKLVFLGPRFSRGGKYPPPVDSVDQILFNTLASQPEPDGIKQPLGLLCKGYDMFLQSDSEKAERLKAVFERVQREQPLYEWSFFQATKMLRLELQWIPDFTPSIEAQTFSIVTRIHDLGALQMIIKFRTKRFAKNDSAISRKYCTEAAKALSPEFAEKLSKCSEPSKRFLDSRVRPQASEIAEEKREMVYSRFISSCAA